MSISQSLPMFFKLCKRVLLPVASTLSLLLLFVAASPAQNGMWPNIPRNHNELVPGTCVIKAQKLKAQGRYEEVVKLLTVCLHDRPDVVALYFYRAEALMHLKRYKEALRDYSAQVRLEPALTKPLELRAHCYLALKKRDKAIRDLSRLTLIQPDYSPAHALLSRLYREKGDLLESRKHELLAKKKKTGAAKVTISPAILTHNFHPAAQAMQAATENMAHGKPGPALQSCKTLLAMSDYDLAAEHIGRYEVYELQGQVYQRIENHAKAIEAFDKVVQLQPKHNRAFYLRAQSFFALGKYAECIADCDRASLGDRLLSKTVGELKSRAQARLAPH